MDDRKHMDALIARAFYSGGIAFNFARNPYLQEAFTYACSNDLKGYKMPGYKKLRTTLLKQERAHIDMLLESGKSTWYEKGVTICADGWTDPQRRPLINFVAISGNKAMFLKADNCEGDVKTKEYIADKLRSVIEEIGRKNVVQIIMDNAANCKEHADDLVYVHSNLRLLSRTTDAYKKGDTTMWDVGGDSFDSLSGLGILEVAQLSIDEPELQAISFGDVEVQVVDEDEAT
ncbi:hypothetical protein PR202_ga16146 [Eleusine coracana subsp. coracana]|uniref:DUF659 domain-containing protein n=1 Tax=Eleusine coracana subsp. coracana TaxID=191504 RepID=A0AAV5CLP2_ELECO|nr:hypothetical protein PR202_ga16146 [Eleusine coracana subsp. coracana]